MKKEVNIKEVKTNPNNPRTIKDSNFKKLEKSIKELSGFLKLRPIIVDEDMMVLGGNMRLKAALSVGKEKVWIDMFTKDMADKMNQEATEQGRKTKTYSDFCKEIIVKDNSGFGEWDIEILTNDYNKEDLIEWGFDSEEVDFFEPETTEGLIDDDEIPEVTEAITKEGDLWLLGDHRLLCGDSTKKDDVERLMDGNKADLLLTDPPYNVDYTGKTKDKLKIQNDSMCDEGFREFLKEAFSNADNVLKAGGVFYIWHADSEGYNFRGACHDINWNVRQCLIWNKNSMVMGRQDYHWKHEPCLYGWKEGAAHYWGTDRKQTTILNFDRPSRSTLHPTSKPVQIIEYQLTNNTKKSQFVLDLFLGSGSTLIACEKTNRKCYGMELDPHYCDVIVKRWEEYTGKKAHKEELIATN